MLEKIKEMVAEQLNVEAADLAAETSFKDDLGADSLDVFQIMMGVEELFDIEISSETVDGLITVGEAADEIRRVVG